MVVRHRHAIALVVAAGAATFFRFYELDRLPPGLNPDEAFNGASVFAILDQHDIQPLYGIKGAREGLFFFLQAPFVAAMGNSILALRMAPALIGVVTVLATYGWARRLWGGRVAALAALYVAVSAWAFIISRNGFRANLSPLLVVVSMWLFTIAYQTRRLRWFALAGLSTGVGMYTYLNFPLFLLVPLLLGAVIRWRMRREGQPFWPRWGRAVVTTAAAFVATYAWMISFYIQHPGEIVGRAAGVSFLTPSLNHGQPLQTLLGTIVKTALMFNVSGDLDYRNNLSGAPELSLFIGIMFLVGLVLEVVRVRRLRHLALITVFVVMLLPEVLTAQGIPHAMRAIGALPATMILAALGTSWVLDGWYRHFPIRRAARATGLGVLLVLLSLTAYGSYREYFVQWAQSPGTYAAYSDDLVAIGSYLNGNAFAGPRYVVVNSYGVETVAYLTHGHSTYIRLDPAQILTLRGNGPKQFLIDESEERAGVADLERRYPGTRCVPGPPGFEGAQLFLVCDVGS